MKEILSAGCHGNEKIIFLHHSTGMCIWKGGVPEWFAAYNAKHGTNYEISERYFDISGSLYHQKNGWENYPYDYWNIWVKNAGSDYFEGEPTLEFLTRQYDVIIFKHCYPGCQILPDTGKPDITSNEKRIENYKLQYEALKKKLHEFPKNKFIVWTGGVPTVDAGISAEEAARAKEFFGWVKNKWDEPDDNIYIWDFWQSETDGDIYMKTEYAVSASDPHPNAAFSKRVAPQFCERIIEVINPFFARKTG